MTAHEAELAGAAGRLRALVAEGRYGEACAALEQYGGVLEQMLRGLRQGDPRIPGMADVWRRFMDETRMQVLAGRAHAAARLAALPRPGLFGDPAPPRRTWQCFL